jgi:hypothetical protein
LPKLGQWRKFSGLGTAFKTKGAAHGFSEAIINNQFAFLGGKQGLWQVTRIDNLIGEPFDFLTWFEFAPEHTQAFEALLERLRATREWNFVEREVDIRLMRLV